MTVTVKKIGGSVGILIPKSMAQEMRLAAGTELTLSAAGDAIVVRKSQRRQARRTRRPIAELVARIKPSSYRRRKAELADGGPLGRELW